jgi:hypothetical protein
MTQSVDRARLKRRTLADAMAALEEAVSKPRSAAGWVDLVSSALADLRSAWLEHVDEVESDDGLLAEVIESAPRLSGAVLSIKTEHTTLMALIDTIAETASSRPAPELVRRRVLNLLGHLTRHRQHGADLVYEAYNVDISASD